MILLRSCEMEGLEKFQLRRWLSLRLGSYDMNLLWEGSPSPLVTFLQNHVIESALLRYLVNCVDCLATLLLLYLCL